MLNFSIFYSSNFQPFFFTHFLEYEVPLITLWMLPSGFIVRLCNSNTGKKKKKKLLDKAC